MKNPFASTSKTNESDNDRNSGMSTPPPAAANNGNKEILIRSPGDDGSTCNTLDMSISCTQVERAEESKLKALENLTEKTGMPITQENGQRRYGPPLGNIAVPPRGSEVFVGKLPRDCYEPEIIPVFEKAGRIYEMRLMMDFSGTNRGYCFVHYFTPEEAARAVSELNNFEIRRGRRIGVVKSVDNCRLFFGDVPKDKDKEEIKKQVDKLTDGVVNVITYQSTAANEKHRGFAFIEYSNHKTAAMARRKLVSGKVQMWGVDISVDWAEPLDSVIKSSMVKPLNNGAQQSKNDLQQPFHRRTRDGTSRVQHNEIKPGIFAPFQPNFSVRQQPILPQGVVANTAQVQENYYQAFKHALEQHSQQNMTFYNNPNPPSTNMHQGTGQLWCGIPGVPPNIYFGQWSPQLIDHSAIPPPKMCNMDGTMLLYNM